MTQPLEEQEHYEEGPKGIKGWLILPVIGLFLTPLLQIFYLGSTFILINSPEWEDVTTPGREGYHFLFKPSIYIELGFNILFVLFCIYLIVLLFQKKKLFPKVIITYYIITILGDLIVTSLVNQINESFSVPDVSISIPAFISSIVWIIYFKRSKRVKNTFVN